MSEPKRIIVGEKYETQELVEMGLLPPEFLVFVDDVPVGYPSASRVTKVDHENKTVTFDCEVKMNGRRGR